MRFLFGGIMRFLSILMICCLLLCSCQGESVEFFDYQNAEMTFECTLVYDGHENGAKITMSAPNENGERENICVEYTEPAIIGGYTLEKADGKYIGKMGGIEIPFGEKTAGVVWLIERIFNLDEEMLSDIKTAENGMTEAEFITEDMGGKVITDENGSLYAIEASFSDGHSISIVLKK